MVGRARKSPPRRVRAEVSTDEALELSSFIWVNSALPGTMLRSPKKFSQGRLKLRFDLALSDIPGRNIARTRSCWTRLQEWSKLLNITSPAKIWQPRIRCNMRNAILLQPEDKSETLDGCGETSNTNLTVIVLPFPIANGPG